MLEPVLLLEGRHHLPYFEGGQKSFGSTNEIGIFEIQSGGLVGVLNPSQVFLERALDGRWFLPSL